MRFVRVDEEKAGLPVVADTAAAHCPPQRLQVVHVDGSVVGQRAVHLHHTVAEGVEERIVIAQQTEARPRMPGRPERGLEVVVESREVVRVARRVALLQVIGGIRAAGEHVEALPC